MLKNSMATQEDPALSTRRAAVGEPTASVPPGYIVIVEAEFFRESKSQYSLMTILNPGRMVWRTDIAEFTGFQAISRLPGDPITIMVNCSLSTNPPGREFAFVDKYQNKWQHLISNCSYDYIYIEKGSRKGYVGEIVDKDENVYRLFLSEGVWK